MTFKAIPLLNAPSVYRMFSFVQLAFLIVIPVLFFQRIRLQKKYQSDRTRIIQDVDMVSLAANTFCHYLKNEILAIKAEIEVERLVGSRGEETEKCLERIDDRCSRIFARLQILYQDSKRQTVHLKKTSLKKLLSEIVDDMQPFPDGIEITLSHPPHDIYCMLDRNLFAHAVDNIISNAIEALESAEKPQKTLCIQMSLNGPYVKISFIDNGIGIPKEYMNCIFEPFFSDKKRSTNNWGMGLSFTRKIVLAHEGRIEALSETGVFTEIQIYLPRLF